MTYSPDEYTERRLANDASRAWAANDGQPWTADEEDILVEYWINVEPRDREEEDISKLLERTIEACRVRCEIIRARGMRTRTTETTTTETTTRGDRVTRRVRTVTETETYRGLLDSDEDRWWDPSYYIQEG